MLHPKSFALATVLLLAGIHSSYAANCAGTGVDFSANEATVPIATFVLLANIPVACGRNSVEVQNQSAATIQVVRDDGSGNNQSTVLLAPAAGAGQQGGGWSSVTFKGRVLVYGPAGSQVSVFQE